MFTLVQNVKLPINLNTFCAQILMYWFAGMPHKDTKLPIFQRQTADHKELADNRLAWL